MTSQRDAVPDAAALLAALSGLSGADPKVIGQAQQTLAEVMAAGAEHRALLERQWAIMHAMAAAVREGDEALGATDQPVGGERQLEQARVCFDAAVDAVWALSEAASKPGDGAMDAVLRHFYDELAKVRDDNNN